MNYPNNYSICNTKDLEVILYANIKDLECLKKENITNTYLEDIEGNIYNVMVNNIENKDKIFIEDSDYYPYHLKLSMSFVSESIIHISDATLTITNKNGTKLSFDIGNISVINKEFSSLVDTKSVSSKTKKVDEYYTLDTIAIELYNKQYNDIILNNIILVSNVVKTTCDNVSIDIDEHYILEVKLDYTDKSFVDHVGIILEWEFNEGIYYQLISPYRLFKTTSKHTAPIIQTYEIY